MESELKDGKLCVPIDELLYEIAYMQPNEYDLVEFVNRMAWMPQITKEVLRIWMQEYSRGSCNSEIHDIRKALLDAVGRREIEFYAGLIANKIEEFRRDDRNYWKLYNAIRDWCNANNIKYPSFSEKEKIDFDYKRELEKIIQEAFNAKLPNESEVNKGG